MKKKFKETINKDDYWLGLAFMVAAGSSSNNRQGCILVGANNEPINFAFDGSLSSTHAHNNSPKNEEHPIHAEMKSVLSSSISGGTAYITHTPCYNCVIALLSCGIRRIIYFSTKTLDSKSTDAVYCAYGQIEEFKGNLNWMRDYINTIDVFN